jgi:DNA-binding SARP family transcriptional activator/predicted ATPase
MAGELQLQLLGGCDIQSDGAAVAALTLNKARALLAYLAVTNRPQLRTHLIDLLWTELPAADARRNLRVVLTKLRQAIGDHLDASRTHVALNTALPRQVDVLTFLATEVHLVRSQTPLSPSAQGKLADAFALYRGDFLAGLEVPHAPGFEEWMLLERERLRQLALRIGERLVDCYIATADSEGAIALCRRLLTLEPWQERNQRRLMTLFAQTGQPTAALQQYEHCRRLLAEELGVEPEPATQALYAAIRDGHTTVPLAHPLCTATETLRLRTVIPLPTTSFLGRAVELATLTDLLNDAHHRLITLVGPGGIGKTRLAQQIAQHFAEQDQAQTTVGGTPRFRDGIFFISAVALPTVDDLVSAVAAALALAFAGPTPPETQLLNHLAGQTLLLVVDNFEHLTPAADRLQRWLHHAPGLTLLVTSRERLNLSAEWLVPVRGLPVPTPTAATDALLANDAVQLFLRRAQRVNLGYTLPQATEADERAALIAICRLLEGMPLAIELAAGWTRTHSCLEILAEIRQNLDFLASELRDIPARHRNLRAAFDHSWRLLDPEDALIVQRLVLLPGGFSGTFAQRIAQATPAALMRLVDKSFLQRDPGQRYTIHELLRQYVAQALPAEERTAILLRYARAFAPWVTQLYSRCESADEPQTLDAVGIEFENLRALWQWLLHECIVSTIAEQPASAAAVTYLATLQALLPMLAYYYLRRSRYQEGQLFFSAALATIEAAHWQPAQRAPVQNDRYAAERTLFWARVVVALAELRFNLSEFVAVVDMLAPVLPYLADSGATRDEAAALTVLGKAEIRMGQYAAAEASLQRGLACNTAGNDRKASAATLNALGILYSNQGNFTKAATYYEAYLALARESGYQRGIANALNNLGSNYARAGDHQRALPLYQETYEVALALDEQLMIAVALSNLGSVARALGNHAEAQHYYAESLRLCRTMGERRWTAAGLNGLGLTVLTQGDCAAAAQHFHEALAIAKTINSAPDLLDALAGLGMIASQKVTTAAPAALLKFVVAQRATQAVARQQSQAHLQQLAAQLTATQLAAAAARAGELTLPAAVELARTLVPPTPLPGDKR